MTKWTWTKLHLYLAPFVTTDLTNKQSSLIRRLVHFISSHEIAKVANGGMFRCIPPFCDILDILRINCLVSTSPQYNWPHNLPPPHTYTQGLRHRGGRGGRVPPFLRVPGIIPPIFRKIVGQIRWVSGFWYELPSEKILASLPPGPRPPHFHRRGGAPAYTQRQCLDDRGGTTAYHTAVWWSGSSWRAGVRLRTCRRRPYIRSSTSDARRCSPCVVSVGAKMRKGRLTSARW